MNYPIAIALTIAVLGVVLALALKSRKPEGHEIEVPAAPWRPGILTGYYGALGDQVAQTIDHITLLWEAAWSRPLEEMIERIKTANVTTTLDIGDWVLQYGTNPRQMKPDAEANLRGVFDRLREDGVLHLVRFLSPCDEPNLSNDGTCDLLPQIHDLMLRVAADYPELQGLGTACIYAANQDMPHIQLWDAVGSDDYDARSGFLAPGAGYDTMRALMRPGQKTILVVGATKGQDPTPFVNKALGSPEVLMFVAFLHCSPPWEKGNLVGLVDQSEEARAQYRAAGLAIKGPQT